MKNLFVLTFLLLSAQLSGQKNDNHSSTQAVARWYLANLDTSKFIYSNLTEVRADYDWSSLQRIDESATDEMGDLGYKYLATVKSPFPEKFKLYVLGLYEGGDCGPAYNLIAVKNELELSSLLLGQSCVWEGEHSETTGKFINDSTIAVTMHASWHAHHENGYVPDKTENRILTSTYKILSNGAFMLSDTTDRKWTTKKQ